MKGAFYPTVEKANLFKDGYIAEKSGHSRGSTVDLAIVDLASLQPKPLKASSTASECNTSSAKRFPDNALDFGTGFDCFDQKSHTAYPNLTSIQKTHRLMLKSMMEKNGFKSLEEEWWHYTLRDEPFKDKYFDFPVE
jgi:D-alanyl-D-alanine dipeptidase